MILRRLTEHVKAQNWFAVGLDFLIVVLGVFIGVQAAEWNTRAGQDRALAGARLRLIEETRQNIEGIDTLLSDLEPVLPVVTAGVEALLVCDGSEEGAQAVNAALGAALVTYGIQIERVTLDEIVDSEIYLSRLDGAERQRLKEYSAFLGMMQSEMAHMEYQPVENLFWRAPSVGFGSIQEFDIPYKGQNFSTRLRNPVLSGSVQEACEDNELVKSLRVWEHYQLIVPTFARMTRTGLEENLRVMEEAAR